MSEPTDLETQLYRSLKMMPCRCIYKWCDGKDEKLLEKQCSRCAAVEEYEKKYNIK